MSDDTAATFTCHIDSRSLKHTNTGAVMFNLIVEPEDAWQALPFLHERVQNQVPLTCHLQIKEEWLEDERAGEARLRALRDR